MYESVWSSFDLFGNFTAGRATNDQVYVRINAHCHSYLPYTINLSSGGSVYIRDPSRVISVNGKEVAPNDARPSAGTVLAPQLDTLSSKYFWSSMTLINSLTRWCRSNSRQNRAKYIDTEQGFHHIKCIINFHSCSLMKQHPFYHQMTAVRL